MRRLFVFLFASSSIFLVQAQQTPLSGPTEGFLFDAPTKSFRAVTGTLGSAFFGLPLMWGVEYGSVAPGQNYGIAFREGRCLLVSGLGSGRVSTAEIPGSFAVPEAVAWSGDGSEAVLYSRSRNVIQPITGLPAAVKPGVEVSVSLIGGTLLTVAADFSGAHIAIGVSGSNSGVFQLAAGQSFVPALSVSEPISLAFSDDGSLYVIDAASNELIKLNMTDFSSQSWPLTGLTDPFAVKPARDAQNRRVIYAAGRKDRLLVAYDASTLEVISTVPLSFEPTAIQTLGRISFSLATRSDTADPLWSFKNTTQPTVYFVPAIKTRLRKDRAQ